MTTRGFRGAAAPRRQKEVPSRMNDRAVLLCLFPTKLHERKTSSEASLRWSFFCRPTSQPEIWAGFPSGQTWGKAESKLLRCHEAPHCRSPERSSARVLFSILLRGKSQFLSALWELTRWFLLTPEWVHCNLDLEKKTIGVPRLRKQSAWRPGRPCVSVAGSSSGGRCWVSVAEGEGLLRCSTWVNAHCQCRARGFHLCSGN